MSRERVEALLRERGEREAARPLFGTATADALREELARDVARTTFRRRIAWIGSLAAALVLAFFVPRLFQPSVAFGELPAEVALLDAMGRPLSVARSADGAERVPASFLVEVVPAGPGLANLFAFGANGVRHRLGEANVAVDPNAELLAAFDSATLGAGFAEAPALWIVAVSSLQPIPPEVLEDVLPERTSATGDAVGPELTAIASELAERLSCTAHVVSLER